MATEYGSAHDFTDAAMAELWSDAALHFPPPALGFPVADANVPVQGDPAHCAQ